MEKQPVDDLFARKLRDAEVPVGPDIFSQLQQRMGVKQMPVRKPVMPWRQIAVAACLLLVAVFLYTINKTDTQSSLKKGQTRSIAKVNNSTPTREPVRKAGLNSNQNKSKQKISDPDQQSVSSDKTTYLTGQSRALLQREKGQIATPARGGQPAQVEQPVERRQEQLAGAVTTLRQADKPTTTVTTQLASTPTPIDKIDRINTKSKQPLERTIVLTIEDVEPAVGLVATDDIRKTDTQGHQNGLSGLFGKLKQLKNGEVMAKATPSDVSQANQKNRFGRVFNEVKESLKNETTLE